MANNSIDDLLSDWGDEIENPIIPNRPKPPSSRSTNSIFDEEDDDDSDDVDLTRMAAEIDDEEDDDDEDDEFITDTSQPNDDYQKSTIDFEDSLPTPDIDSLPVPNIDSLYDEDDDLDNDDEQSEFNMPSSQSEQSTDDEEFNEDEDDDYDIPSEASSIDEDDEFPELDFPAPGIPIDEVNLDGIQDDAEKINTQSPRKRQLRRSTDVDELQEDESTPPVDKRIPEEALTEDNHDLSSLSNKVGNIISKSKDNSNQRFKLPKITAAGLINTPLLLLRKIRKARRMYWIASSLAGVFVLLWSFLNIGAANNKGGAVDTAVNEGSVEVASASWKDGHVEAVLRNKSEMVAHVAGEVNVKTWSPDYRPASWVSPRVVMSCKIPQEDIDPGKSITVKPNDCRGKVHGVWPRVQAKLDYQ